MEKKTEPKVMLIEANIGKRTSTAWVRDRDMIIVGASKDLAWAVGRTWKTAVGWLRGMGRMKSRIVAQAPAAALLVSMVLVLGGCHAGPSLDWAREYVSGERAAFDVVVPDLLEVERQLLEVASDTTQTPARRQEARDEIGDREDFRYSWGRRIESGMAVIRALEGR